VKFSIIIPFYNNGESLDILDLVVSDYRDDPEVEVIFIEDKGNDEDYFMLLNRFDKISNVKIYRNNTNSGPARTRINGIKEALGEYLFFLDADDGWCKNRAYKIYSICKLSNLNIIGGHAEVCDKTKFKQKRYEEIKEENCIKAISIKDTIFFNPYSTSSVCVKREIMLKHLFDENMRYAEDIDCWRRVIMLEGKAAKLSQSGSYLFKHAYLSGNGLSSNTLMMTKGANYSLFKILKNRNSNIKIKFYCILGLIFGLLKGIFREVRRMGKIL